MASPAPQIVHLEETVSTNADAWRLARAGEALPLWVMADRQTGGRGRSGRAWVSAPGNLFASVAFASDAPAEQMGEVALLAGIALHDAVQSAFPLAAEAGLRLKWPNDLMLGPAKAGGILVESATVRTDAGLIAVAGFGVNVAAAPDGIDRAAATLAACGPATPATAFLPVLARSFSEWLARWDDSRGFKTVILPAWQERAGPPGELVQVHARGAVVAGRYMGLDPNGHMRLETADGQHITVSHGDVELAGGLVEKGTP
jgi:BirA family transcriptional regulator, biotin operon repressor / biotin---[acetyl-CoA-carboxylase] ligase